MTKKSNRIVFFGSGPVAAKSLKLLLEHQQVELIITKPSTKSMMQTVSPDTPLKTVSTRAELDDLIRDLAPANNAGVLVDFGIIVSQEVIDYFEHGIINSHFSLLPQWRGADPITFSILSGQDKTGVSLMLLSAGMDEGLIVAQAEHTLTPTHTTEKLTDELIELSDALLTTCIDSYVSGDILPIDQESAANLLGNPYEISYSRKLTKQDGEIDWSKPAVTIEREIRAYLTWPKSYTNLNGIGLIIKQASVIEDTGKPGTYVITKDSLVVHCGEKSLSITALQPAGKKEMPVKAFLAGYQL